MHFLFGHLIVTFKLLQEKGPPPGDDLDGLHEDVGNDGHAHEGPEQAQQVDDRPDLHRPRVLVDQRQQQPHVRARVAVHVTRRHGGGVDSGDVTPEINMKYFQGKEL